MLIMILNNNIFGGNTIIRLTYRIYKNITEVIGILDTYKSFLNQIQNYLI